MNFLARILVCLVFSGVGSGVAAQVASQAPLEIEPSGEAYLQALRWRGIDSDVAYFDPTAPPPEFTTTQDVPQVQSRERREWTVSDQWVTLIMGVILAAIVFFLYRYGGNISVSLKSDAANPARQRGAANGGMQDLTDGLPQNLRDITRISDRRRAVVLLAQYALSKAIAAEGVREQRSWTARDALRRLPRDHPYAQALRDLVLDGERVHFGGRDISEERFGAHVSQITPMLRGLAAT